MTFPDRTSSVHPIRVERIAEQHPDGTDVLTVQVVIDPLYVLPELIRALGAHPSDMLTIHALRIGDTRWHNALGRIGGDPRVQTALTVALGPSQADDTATALADAIEAPTCLECDRLVDNGSPVCCSCTAYGEHLDARCRA